MAVKRKLRIPVNVTGAHALVLRGHFEKLEIHMRIITIVLFVMSNMAASAWAQQPSLEELQRRIDQSKAEKVRKDGAAAKAANALREESKRLLAAVQIRVKTANKITVSDPWGSAPDHPLAVW